MSAYDLILVVLVAVGAFAMGYQFGRFKALNERSPSGRADEDGPLPGPLDGPLSDATPSRPRAPPPPTSAGDGGGSWSGGSGSGGSSSGGSTRSAGAGPVRRSTKPPPAAAGLLDKGSGKSGKGPK
jgi:hypothetical protein